MATQFSIIAWKIPWAEETGGLQTTGLQRCGHDGTTQHQHYAFKVIYTFNIIYTVYNYKLFSNVRWKNQQKQSQTLKLLFSLLISAKKT